MWFPETSFASRNHDTASPFIRIPSDGVKGGLSVLGVSERKISQSAGTVFFSGTNHFPSLRLREHMQQAIS